MMTIRPQELNVLRNEDQSLELIDVRTPGEYREVHVPFARNVPLSDLDPNSIRNSKKLNKPLYFICKSGSRGKQACEKLIASGYDQVFNVEGGTQAWVDAGLPVIRGKRAISLERQVRIAAGLLVLIGVMLGYFVHEIFLGLAGFVGAGLTFSGLTDTCGMGILLSKMPWNRVREKAALAIGVAEISGTQACPKV